VLKLKEKQKSILNMKIIGKILFYLILFVILGFLLVQLFFKDEVEKLKTTHFHPSNEVNLSENKKLVVAYSFNSDSFEPTFYDSVTRSRTSNIYEGLVLTDRNLEQIPGLALSWGEIDDTTWEFKLRPNVIFHDGTDFDADDVIASFKRAKTYKSSGLKDILSTISSIKKIDKLTVHIITKEPDPILVSRVATVFIFPSEKTDFKKPVGTGPYKFVSNTKTEFSIKRFDDYWGKRSHYKDVVFKTIPNKFDRLDAIKNGEVDILANVPPSFTDDLKMQRNVTITSLPSLEVNFLIFNFKSKLLKDDRIRKAISIAFDRDVFVEISNGFASPSNQFISNGIFGFNPNIKSSSQDITEAKNLIRQYDPFKKPSVTIDMTNEAQAVGDYIKSQLNEIGLSVKINYISFEELKKKIFDKTSEMYYLGWRSEVGDASGFYENVVYSKGRFNGGNFNNKKVDQLIALSTKNLNEKKRLEQFQEIMKIILDEKIIGVPLFETDTIYAVRAGIGFRPRLDGYILVSEIL